MVKRILKSYDYTLITIIILLAIFGLVMVYSASNVTAIQRYGYAGDHFYQRQKISLLIGFCLFLITAIFPYKAFKSNKILIPMVFISLIVLAFLHTSGYIAGNAKSWLEIKSFRFQPSEFIKLSVIIYLSAIYAKKQSYINEFNKGIVPPLIYLVLVSFLVAIEPDFGTAFIILFIGATIVITSGINFRNLLKLISIGLLFAGTLFIALKDRIFSENKLGRIDGFLDPFGNVDEGWQLVNSYLAIGSGGIKGLGLGQSVQKLGYLPEGHTDFIMAIISEELGIFGVGFVILALAFIVLKGIYIGIKCQDRFGSLLAIGISSMIGVQSFINLAGVSGLIPITGVPLPLISYGGSSLLQLGLSLGILANVSMFVNYEKKYRHMGESPNSQTRPSTVI